ncbi:RNA polymerase sigma-70 factor [Catenuloplanes atrovinosus]|uniref:RNA polymerase sigma-70 factor (ECF subfamily) n=1 Tax=Catenuloplanes atrovinosus TaxID=137266 RepID=A0AAE3YRS6_9ACTN|nr:RNA polymerase sigma-70 factor [Catenuloplanes atrovinosus]MDR7276561.1 RNA polymerase sigma-70 factor (ECF subfamily) [Catenuloplanes atrovinosus]
MTLTSDEVELFARVRGRLEAIAYRMLGSAADAEDAVQDTFLRWQAADRERIETPEAWLTRVLTNVCLNELTSARARRETYVGRWLPEPVPAGDPMLGPAESAEQRESVSIAVLTLMERLSPQERAVYVLRTAFGYPHAEIAGMLGLTEANCQQLYRRARQHLADGRTRTPVDAATARSIAERFLAAAVSGEVEPLVRMLAGDAISMADGGGQVPARSTPIVGALAIARFLRTSFQPAAARRFVGEDLTLHADVVNGGPAVVATAGERIVGVLVLDVTEDGIAAIHVQANPAKLERLGRR